MENNILNSRQLGVVIKNARKSQGITQDDLAGMTGIGRRFIGDLESGKETAQIGKALHVLSALGISISATHKWKK